MAIEVDHVFICCAAGAPEGDALVELGLREGSPKTHPGQGTANRRFFFRNMFLELLWVSAPAEARSAQTRRTQLWERWSARSSTACPFGIVFRPRGAMASVAPFATWHYRPTYLPAGCSIEVAEGTALEEPGLFYLPFLRRSGAPPHEPREHAVDIRQIEHLAVGLPAEVPPSEALIAACGQGQMTCFRSASHLLELVYAASDATVFDLRPVLPLRFRGMVIGDAERRVDPRAEGA